MTYKSQTPESNALRNAIDRCERTSHPQYNDYGGRGIRVCNEWKGPDRYDKFLAHIGRRPGPEYSLDRIDNNGHYEPGNVKWATRSEQQLNRRGSLVTIAGRSQNADDWAKELKISKAAFKDRLFRKLPEFKLLHVGRLPRSD